MFLFTVRGNIAEIIPTQIGPMGLSLSNLASYVDHTHLLTYGRWKNKTLFIRYLHYRPVITESINDLLLVLRAERTDGLSGAPDLQVSDLLQLLLVTLTVVGL